MALKPFLYQVDVKEKYPDMDGFYLCYAIFPGGIKQVVIDRFISLPEPHFELHNDKITHWIPWEKIAVLEDFNESEMDK